MSEILIQVTAEDLEHLSEHDRSHVLNEIYDLLAEYSKGHE